MAPSADKDPLVDKDPSVDTGLLVDTDPSGMDHDSRKRTVRAAHNQAACHDDHNTQWTLCYRFEVHHGE